MKKHELFQMHAARVDDVERLTLWMTRTACYLAVALLAFGL